MTIHFIYRTVVTGGVETLILRMGKKFSSENIQCNVICQEISGTMESQLKEVGINIIQLKQWTFSKAFSFIRKKDIVYTFFLRDFLEMEILKKMHSHEGRIFLYVVNSATFFLLRLNKIKFLAKLVKNYFRKIIYFYIDNGNIIFMNEMCIEYMEDFYKKKVTDPQDKIFRLPIENGIRTVEKRKSDEIHIVSIARADFPYKGYLLGMVDAFGPLFSKYENITLTIISYGEHIDQLKERIRKVDKKYKHRIHLIGETKYAELEEYYQQADLYIGLGTTVLEAAKYGVITINMMMHTNEFQSGGFFHERYDVLCALKDQYTKGEVVVEKALSFTEEERERYSKLTYDLFMEHYSIDTIVPKMLERQVKPEDGRVLTLLIAFVRMGRFVKGLIRRK